MTVTRAERSDLETILKIQYAAYKSEAVIYNDFALPPLTQPLSELESEFERGIFLKAVDEDGEIVGSVRTFPNGATTNINKLIVRLDRQGQGIGSTLLMAVEHHCNSKRYELFTGHKSVRTIKLYERFGYKIFKKEKITEIRSLVYMEKYADSCTQTLCCNLKYLKFNKPCE